MELMKGFNDIIEQWNSGNGDGESAKLLSLKQLEAFEDIINDDKSWNKLLEIFNNGRVHDSWLAADWPNGFDELILCAPLCKFVEWECARCHVGKRQKNFSCANDDSLFGYIAVLLSIENREILKEHINKIKHLLTKEEVYWEIERHELYLK